MYLLWITLLGRTFNSKCYMLLAICNKYFFLNRRCLFHINSLPSLHNKTLTLALCDCTSDYIAMCLKVLPKLLGVLGFCRFSEVMTTEASEAEEKVPQKVCKVSCPKELREDLE